VDQFSLQNQLQVAEGVVVYLLVEYRLFLQKAYQQQEIDQVLHLLVLQVHHNHSIYLVVECQA